MRKSSRCRTSRSTCSKKPARGRKGTGGQNRDRRALDIYPTRVRFMEASPGWKFVLEPHQEHVDDTPTI